MLALTGGTTELGRDGEGGGGVAGGLALQGAHCGGQRLLVVVRQVVAELVARGRSQAWRARMLFFETFAQHLFSCFLELYPSFVSEMS